MAEERSVGERMLGIAEEVVNLNRRIRTRNIAYNDLLTEYENEQHRNEDLQEDNRRLNGQIEEKNNEIQNKNGQLEANQIVLNEKDVQIQSFENTVSANGEQIRILQNQIEALERNEQNRQIPFLVT